MKTTWREVAVKDHKNANGPRWGGKNDGIWRGPLKGMSLIVDRGKLKRPEMKRARLLVEEIEVIPTPSAK